ncbi:MAG: hypothetical protein AB7T06_46210 [Kofleriaceae bacterium]
MPRFRETLWFKKGTEAAPEQPSGDHERPLEDRYDDDGSISLIDHVQFSVVTGTTQPVRIFTKVDTGEDADKTMQMVVGQMQRGRGKLYAMIGASMACAVAAIAMLVA